MSRIFINYQMISNTSISVVANDVVILNCLIYLRKEIRYSLFFQALIQLFSQRGVQSWIYRYRRNVALSLVNYWAYSQTSIGPYTLHRYLRLFHSKCNRPIQVSVYDHNVQLFKLIIQCGP